MRGVAALLLVLVILSRGIGSCAAADLPSIDPATPTGAPRPAYEELFRAYLDTVRQRFLVLARAAPSAPGELAAVARRLSDSAAEAGVARVLIGFLVMVAGGIGLETAFRWATRARRRRIAAAQPVTVRERVAIVMMRLCYPLLGLLMFAAGSIGAFLLFAWPPPLGALLLDYLVAVLVLRVAVALGRFVLAPQAERFRLLPLDTHAARFWQRRLGTLVAIAAFGWATAAVVDRLGASPTTAMLIQYGFGLVLAGAVVWTELRRRLRRAPPLGEQRQQLQRRRHRYPGCRDGASRRDLPRAAQLGRTQLP